MVPVMLIRRVFGGIICHELPLKFSRTDTFVTDGLAKIKTPEV